MAINSGSSSFKYKLFSLPAEVIAKEWPIVLVLPMHLLKLLADGQIMLEKQIFLTKKLRLTFVLKFLKEFNVVEDLNEIVGVGHRVVNGGEYFKDSTIINKENLQKIYELQDYAHFIPSRGSWY